MPNDPRWLVDNFPDLSIHLPKLRQILTRITEIIIIGKDGLGSNCDLDGDDFFDGYNFEANKVYLIKSGIYTVNTAGGKFWAFDNNSALIAWPGEDVKIRGNDNQAPIKIEGDKLTQALNSSEISADNTMNNQILFPSGGLLALESAFGLDFNTPVILAISQYRGGIANPYYPSFLIKEIKSFDDDFNLTLKSAYLRRNTAATAPTYLVKPKYNITIDNIDSAIKLTNVYASDFNLKYTADRNNIVLPFDVLNLYKSKFKYLITNEIGDYVENIGNAPNSLNLYSIQNCMIDITYDNCMPLTSTEFFLFLGGTHNTINVNMINSPIVIKNWGEIWGGPGLNNNNINFYYNQAMAPILLSRQIDFSLGGGTYFCSNMCNLFGHSGLKDIFISGQYNTIQGTWDVIATKSITNTGGGGTIQNVY